MSELNDIATVAAIMRDLGIAILAVVVAAVAIGLLIMAIRLYWLIKAILKSVIVVLKLIKLILRKVNSLLSTLANLLKPIDEMSNTRKRRADKGFNFGSWLFAPFKHIVSNRVRNRAENGNSRRSK